MEIPAEYNILNIRQKKVIREQYVEIQKGMCYYCKAPLAGKPATKIANKEVKPKLYPKGFFNNPVHLHHSHLTGLTLGAVHCHCNAVLWEYHGE